MATSLTNLSSFDPADVPNAASMRIGIVVSEWNGEITNNLCSGAQEALKACGAIDKNVSVHSVPGSFELPLGAQILLETSQYDAVICLGCVIRGETAHFDFVCSSAAQGIQDVGLKYNRPVVFGVLTDDNIEQSRARSGGAHGNKGVESAITAIKMVALRQASDDSAWLL